MCISEIQMEWSHPPTILYGKNRGTPPGKCRSCWTSWTLFFSIGFAVRNLSVTRKQQKLNFFETCFNLSKMAKISAEKLFEKITKITFQAIPTCPKRLKSGRINLSSKNFQRTSKRSSLTCPKRLKSGRINFKKGSKNPSNELRKEAVLTCPKWLKSGRINFKKGSLTSKESQNKQFWLVRNAWNQGGLASKRDPNRVLKWLEKKQLWLVRNGWNQSRLT